MRLLAAANGAMGAAHPVEAFAVLREHLSGKWPSKHVGGLVLAMHKALDEPGRLSMLQVR